MKNEIIAKYTELTDNWLKEAIPNNKPFNERHYFCKDGIRYRVDGKTIKHNYSKTEEEMALFIQKNLGGNIYMVPRVRMPENIKTPDYQYINHEFRINDMFDLKTTNSTSLKAISNIASRGYGQSNSFIFHFTNKNVTNAMITKQINNLYKDPARRFVNMIIIIKGGKIRIFKR